MAAFKFTILNEEIFPIAQERLNSYNLTENKRNKFWLLKKKIESSVIQISKN